MLHEPQISEFKNYLESEANASDRHIKKLEKIMKKNGLTYNMRISNLRNVVTHKDIYLYKMLSVYDRRL